MKHCGTCDTTKPHGDFNRRRSTPDGYDKQCRECVNAKRREFRARNLERERARDLRYRQEDPERFKRYASEWRARNAEKLRAKDRQRRSSPELRAARSARRRDLMYGLAEGQYDQMVADQGGKCAICGETPKKLVVDHCHTSGEVRELLCSNCNSGLGLLNEDLDRLLLAAAYIEKHMELKWQNSTEATESLRTPQASQALAA